MKNLNFLAVTGCGLLVVFLISFTAACNRQSGAANAPVMQADSGGLQSVGTVDKTENGTADAGQVTDDSGASVQDSVSHESVGQAQEATVKTGKDSEGAADGKQDTGQTMDRGGEEAGDTGQVSGNDGGEAGDESLVSGNGSAEAGDTGQVSGNDNGESAGQNQVSGNNSGASVSGNQVSGNSGPGSDGGENQISGNRIPARQLLRPCGGSVSGSSISENDISGNSLSGSTSGNSISANSISQNSTGGNKNSKKENSSGSESGKEESGGSSSDSTVSGSSTSGNSVSGSSASGNSVSDSDIIAHMGRNTAKLEDPFDRKHYTLAQRQAVRSSHKETLLANELDKQTISGNNIDFSDIKITCLGDSITQAVNLDNLDNYQELAYPHILQETLDARKVYNLGIGGSSIGRYWADAFVDRYQKIPEDSDIILVMGGTNDEFCASLVEFGNPAERKRRTFWGDLDELMDGLKTDYPNAEVIFMTPLPNSLQDYLKIQHPYLIPQDKFADVIKELADEHGMEVIDLYNSNILDGHDKDNVLHFMPDGVHPNADGYEILGEHVAADLIRILQSRQKKGTDSQ